METDDLKAFFELMDTSEKKLRDMMNEFELIDYGGPDEHSPEAIYGE